MSTIKENMLRALIFLGIMILICGIGYPLVMTGISQVVFAKQANGSMITIDGKTYGSALLGQEFQGEEYLHGRISQGGPSNKSPAGDGFEETIKERVKAIKAENPAMGETPIPVDLVTNSGSGLDPHISPLAAEYQVERIAAVRNMEAAQVRETIKKCTTDRFLGVFGEKAVNVLEVNLALDDILK